MLEVQSGFWAVAGAENLLVVITLDLFFIFPLYLSQKLKFAILSCSSGCNNNNFYPALLEMLQTAKYSSLEQVWAAFEHPDAPRILRIQQGCIKAVDWAEIPGRDDEMCPSYMKIGVKMFLQSLLLISSVQLMWEAGLAPGLFFFPEMFCVLLN